MDIESFLPDSESKVNSRRPLIFFFLLPLIFLLALLNGALLVHQFHRLPSYCSLLEYNPTKSPRNCLRPLSSSRTQRTQEPLLSFSEPNFQFQQRSSGTGLLGCASALDDALSRLNGSDSVVYFDLGLASLKESSIGDLKEWIGAALRDQQRCLEELPEAGSAVADVLRLKVQESKVYASNSLAILSNIRELKANLDACGLNFEYKLSFCIFCLEYLVVIWLFCLLMRIKDNPTR
ncbi:Pectinesterase [Bertholletia excelsa]